MKPIDSISFLLFLIVAVTIINLYWRSGVQDTPRNKWNKGPFLPIDPLEAVQCPTRGFKCHTPHCDCQALCSDQFEAFHVKKGDDIIVRDQRVEPGTYCLPKGISTCNQKTSMSIFSASGWLCAPRNRDVYHDNHTIACKNSQAKDNTLNVLWDRLENQPAHDKIRDFYETLDDGAFRYSCQCGSEDLRGNRMIQALPFLCLVDYCVVELKNAKRYGWNGKGCSCGPHQHSNPLDDTSPCVPKQTRIENHTLEAHVKCTMDDDFEKGPMFCPTDEGMVNFSTRLSADIDHTLFLYRHT